MACVRVCPVEAIAVDDDEVRIAESTCIECGLCAPACHHEAIDIVGDREAVEAALGTRRVLLILPIEAVVHFYPATPEQLINACVAAGFERVYFDLLGDELVAEEYLKLLRSEDRADTVIRSTSPIVVEYCRQLHPELLPFLAPVATPTSALARYLRSWFPEDTDIVYAGLHSPAAAGESDEITACLSLEELEGILRSRDTEPTKQPLFLTTWPTERRRHLSTAGGLPLSFLDEQRLSSRSFRKLRNLKSLAAVSHSISRNEQGLGFVDVLPFDGLLAHPQLGPEEEIYWRRSIVELAEQPRASEPVIETSPGFSLKTDFRPSEPTTPAADVTRFEQVLDEIGRTPTGAFWDCGACGFDRCTDFALSVARGRGTLQICPYYLNRRYEAAARDATHDALTGLLTYRVLNERLSEEVARANRSGSTLSVLFMDLDDFKEINDRFGHAIGNHVLRAVGDILSSVIRTTDIAGRFGGDEFMLILVNSDAEGSVRVAEQIRERVQQLSLPVPDTEAGVTLSIGVAYHSGAERSVLTSDALFAEADASLYVAKAQGGNTVHPAGPGGRAR